MNVNSLRQQPTGRFFHGLTILILIMNLFLIPNRQASALPATAPRMQVFDCSAVTEIPQAECEALVDLYNSTDGPNWIKNSNWLQSNTPCSWGIDNPYGVLRQGVTCENGHVVDLVLEDSDLNGVIPPSIGNLTFLDILDLRNNHLTGAIPSEIGKLANVRLLYLNDNQLNGPIPPEFGNLSSLYFLYINNNSFNSPLPPEFGNLSQLAYLLAYNAHLTGNIPDEFGNLTQLSHVSLEQNSLDGPLPESIGNLNRISYINISANHLSGQIPASIGNWSQATEIWLFENNLSGNIPSSIGNLTTLWRLGLHNNQLTGNIPGDIGNLVNLRHLSLANNQLSGEVPASITNLVLLTHLTLNCGLTSSNPDVITFLDQLNPGWQCLPPPPPPPSLPSFIARLTLNYIDQEDWPIGDLLNLTIDDPDTVASPDYTDQAIVEPDRSDIFRFDGLYDLKIGDVVTVSNGSIIKSTTVADVVVTSVDAENDVVTGSADIGIPRVWVRIWSSPHFISRWADVEGGVWHADFSVVGTDPEDSPGDNDIWDIKPGDNGIVRLSDEDGDTTSEYWEVPNSRFHVQMVENNVQGYDWPVGADITLMIDGQEIGTLPVIPNDENSDIGWVSFDDLHGIDLAPDMFVTMTNGTITKTHTVTNVVVTGVDVDANTVSGTGTPGVNLNVQHCNESGCLWRRWATVQPDGTWQANFSVVGAGPDEQLILNIVPGMIGEALEPDEDADHTDYQWRVLNPNFRAEANSDYIEGYEWPLGATVNLEIDDPDTQGINPDYTDSTTVAAVEWDPNQTWFNFQLDSYDLKTGDTVNISDGTFTKQLTLVNVAIADVDLDADIVYGTADENQPVSISACGDGFCFFRDEVADSSGNWSANFAISSNGPDDTLDLQSGLGISAFIWDQDGDQTSFGLTTDWVPPASIPLVFAISSPVDLRVPVATVEIISVLNTLNESLFMLDKDNRLVPLAAAAEPVVSPEGLTYTVTLRPGAVWSDDEPVTAQHFVDGILRVLDPNVGSDYGFLLLAIKNAKAFNDGTLTDPSQVGIKALNAQTLEITLEQRTAHFLNVLASPAILPARQDVIGDFGDSWTSPTHYVSNGPYKLLEYDSGHIVVEQNPLYNGPIQTVFSQIAFDVIPDPDQQVAAYKNGDVDVLIGTPLATIMNDEALRQNMTVLPSPGVQYVGFTAQVSPTGNPLVRKALASAIDRQALIDNVLQTSWRVEATGVIPPELTGYQGSEVGYVYDATQARSFLAQAGYPGGVGFPALEIMSGPNQAAVIEELATQWETVLGITVNIHYLSGGERFQALKECQQNPSNCSYNAYLSGWFIDYPDAYNILNDLFHPDSPYNYTGWDNPTYRNLINLAVSELNPAQRTADLQQAEQLLVEGEAVVAPLFHTDYVMVVRPGIFPYYSPTFFTNLAYWSNVDPNGDGMGAAVIGSEGGTVATENDTVSAEIPAGALDEDVTLSITDLGGNYQITDSGEPLNVITAYSIQPHGLQFATPVALTFAWNDADNNGFVDGTDWSESNIVLIKDGEPITQSCDLNPNCDKVANILTVEVSSLSHFELSVPSDTTPPTITWSGDIQEGNSFYFGFVPAAPTCSASDTLSGVDGACTVSGYASTPGMHTLTATATDHAGNVATEMRYYTVLAWTLNGFYQPVDMNGVYNLVKGGSTVPVKFEIFAGPTELTSTSSIRSFGYAQMACEPNAIIDAIEVTVANGSGLRYDSTAGQFIYNWKTPSNAGKCYRLTMTTMDGSSLTAFFKLK